MNAFINYINTIPDENLIINFIISAMILTWVFVAITMVVSHLITAIPLYIMASKAGYDYPFLAFIPIANYYLMYVLPVKEYSFMGMYKSLERRNGFFLHMVIKYIIPFCLGFVFMFLSFIPFVSAFISLLSGVFSLALRVVGLMALAIMRIDLLEVYMKESKEAAIAVGVISLFVPLVFPIALYILCGKEPVFGFGNYYEPWINDQAE